MSNQSTPTPTISSPFPEPLRDLLSSTKSPLLQHLTLPQLEALKFGLNGAFLGGTAGLTFGGVTTLMRGLESTPAGRANLLKSVKIFSLVGFSYGVVGAGTLLVRPEKDYLHGMAAGCSAGLSMGIYNRSLAVGCVGCVTLGALAAFAKFMDERSPTQESPTLKMFTEPQFRRDEKWTHSSK